MFLDIQMPKLDGFEVLELIGNDTAVVFVTAYDSYAIKAFEVHAVDYLLKPFGADRFEASLETRQRAPRRQTAGGCAVRARFGRRRAPACAISSIASRCGTALASSSFPSPSSNTPKPRTITSLSPPKAGKHLKQQTISSLESALDPSRFMRIHRSYIVNLERVAKVEPYGKDSHVAVLANGTQLPVSRAGYARLRAFLDR